MSKVLFLLFSVRSKDLLTGRFKAKLVPTAFDLCGAARTLGKAKAGAAERNRGTEEQPLKQQEKHLRANRKTCCWQQHRQGGALGDASCCCCCHFWLFLLTLLPIHAAFSALFSKVGGEEPCFSWGESKCGWIWFIESESSAFVFKASSLAP